MIKQKQLFFCALFIMAQAVCITNILKAQTNVFPADGNVGIGTYTPLEKFEVEGNGLFTGKLGVGYPHSGLGFTEKFSINGDGAVVGNFNIYGGHLNVNGGHVNANRINSAANTDLALFSQRQINLIAPSGATISTNGSPGLNIITSGSAINMNSNGIGIDGDPSSSYKLFVRGTAFLLGLNMPIGAQVGYLLTSDANGNATWQPAPPAAPSYFSLIGNEVTVNNPYILRAPNGIRVGTTSLVLSGTTTPGTTNDIYASNGPLYLQSNTGNTFNTILNRNGGNVGIGVANPTLKLSVNGGIGWGNNSLNTDQGGSIELGGSNSIAGVGIPYIDFHYNGLVQDYNARIINNRNGELTIQATNGLTVDGRGIIARRVRVNTALSWADYVFSPSYQLKSLGELEEYIKENKHLPDVPSEEEVKKEGFDLADMNRILLQKIEENTLYLIELKKENEELKEKMVQLEKRIK